MSEATQPIDIVLRIPGVWAHPGELIGGLPEGYRLTPDALFMPDGTKVEFNPLPPDGQFPEVFRSSCRQPPEPEVVERIGSYTVNACLRGPGGSLDAAQQMMEAGAALVRAGGLGVFIDNSALAHGGQLWLEMTDDASADALSFAFVSVIRGQTEVWTMGMHVLGLRDVVMQRTDVEEGGFDIIEVLRYLARGEKPVADGHIIADENGPQFQVFAAENDPRTAGSPMHNPFGRLKLVSVKDIAGQN